MQRVLGQQEMQLAFLAHDVGACRDHVLRTDPVQPDALDDMPRKGVEFAHQDGKEAQRRVEPENHGPRVRRLHAQGVRRDVAPVDCAGIRYGVEIAQNGKALARVDDAAGRPGDVLRRQRMSVRPDEPVPQPEGPGEAVGRDGPIFGQTRRQAAIGAVLGQAGMDLLVDQRRRGEFPARRIEAVRQAGQGHTQHVRRRRRSPARGERSQSGGGKKGASVQHGPR